jgi:hypothetical protein
MVQSKEEEKEYQKKYHREYYIRNKERLKISRIEYRSKNKEKIKDTVHKYYEQNKEEIQIKRKEYDIKNRDRNLKRKKEYNSREDIKQHRAEYYSNNKEHLNKMSRKYKSENKESLSQKKKIYRARPEVRIRNWCHSTLKKHESRGYIVEITIDELYKYASKIKLCGYCNKKINWSPNLGHVQPDSPTLDRVNNGKILDHIWEDSNDTSEGAIEIICYQCNISKSNRNYEEFIAYCRHIIKSHEDRQV